MNDDRAALRELLWAMEVSYALRPDAPEYRDVQPLIAKVGETFATARPNYFRSRFYTSSETVSMVGDGQYLYLRPPENERDVIPVMAVDAMVTKTSATVKVQIALFKKDRTPKALGYRFEYGGGSHEMLHCPHITEFTSTNAPRIPLPGAPGWIPTTQPSFPLDGQSEGVHCVLAAYISIYGLGELGKLRAQCASIETYMTKLHCNPFPKRRSGFR